ncbi:hypothetical protein OBBRIDRAFT_807110 [Obba rivulosa]|uniref:Uncharacterized protein n=1 Tax=Obba rivulosa TaxID=1052685 RepID=A0A8E2API1_9APHY|nr:hypothetical protein OBBRIDRAFT_807110 [Obba rivulosa]
MVCAITCQSGSIAQYVWLPDFNTIGDFYTSMAQAAIGKEFFSEDYYVSFGVFTQPLILVFIKHLVILAWDCACRGMKRNKGQKEKLKLQLEKHWCSISISNMTAYMRILARYGADEEVAEIERWKEWLLLMMQALGVESKNGKLDKKILFFNHYEDITGTVDLWSNEFQQILNTLAHKEAEPQVLTLHWHQLIRELKIIFNMIHEYIIIP